MRRDVAARARPGGVKMRRCSARRYDAVQLSATEMKLFVCAACRLIFTVYNQTEPSRLDIAAD